MEWPPCPDDGWLCCELEYRYPTALATKPPMVTKVASPPIACNLQRMMRSLKCMAISSYFFHTSRRCGSNAGALVGGIPVGAESAVLSPSVIGCLCPYYISVADCIDSIDQRRMQCAAGVAIRILAFSGKADPRPLRRLVRQRLYGTSFSTSAQVLQLQPS